MPYTTITPDEWKLACQVGLDRAVSAIKRKLKDSVNKKKNWLDDLDQHVKGAVGELAASKVLGVQWTGSVDTFKSASDLDGNIEIRFRSNPEWDLIVREDRDDAKLVLVRGMPPGAIEVAGWIMGKDAKQDRWKARHGGLREAYFVPAGELRDVGELLGAARQVRP